MKYVMIRVRHGTVERDLPIIFPDMLVHKHVSDRICQLLTMGYDASEARSVSAGSIQVHDVCCHGASETLGLKSRDAVDDAIIENYDYQHGVVP